jgi:STE24 endopeptidase
MSETVATAAPSAGAPTEVDLEERERQARALGATRRRKFVLETLLNLALPLLAWASGLSGGLARALGLPGVETLAADGPRAWIALAGYVVALLLLYRLVLLPLSYFADYRLSRRYGLSTQSPRAWLVDWLKATLIGLVLGTIVALLFYAAVVGLGAAWWIGLAALLSAGVLLLTYVAPYVLVPIFYKLRPLEPGPVTERIEAVFSQAGARRPLITSIDLSSRTTAANAAVIGMGSSRRVVLGDTLLATFGLEEVASVVAHELGHHLRLDIWRGLAIEFAVIWGGLALAGWLLTPLFGAWQAGDWRAPAQLPLLFLLAEAAGLVIMPLINAFSRSLERTADRFALELTGDPAAFAGAMRKLAAQNLIELDPPRWSEVVMLTHPAPGRRIRMAEGWSHA